MIACADVDADNVHVKDNDDEEDEDIMDMIVFSNETLIVDLVDITRNCFTTFQIPRLYYI